MLSHYYCNGDGIVCLYTTNPVAIAYTHRQCFDVIFIHDEKLITKVLLTFFSLSLVLLCVCVCSIYSLQWACFTVFFHKKT